MFAEHYPDRSTNMQILTACPLCQANYNPLKTQIMAERDDAHLLYLQCRQCGSSVVAVVTTGVAGLSSISAITDLTSQEIMMFREKSEVSLNDVLELHQWWERDDRIHLPDQSTRF